eukprot:TRINITY_DN96330_c0_g1_i1.p1 TRINITY_DN96330_c0_g1~~TRINITY_DN96330_c0_g1_i1.p1  ORF type:complete len:449 (-),score=70.69 TRINITY_DN96330_c0_g1_i1:8-1324(-)
MALQEREQEVKQKRPPERSSALTWLPLPAVVLLLGTTCCHNALDFAAPLQKRQRQPQSLLRTTAASPEQADTRLAWSLAARANRPLVQIHAQRTSPEPSSQPWHLKVVAWASAGVFAVRRVFRHRVRQPVQRAGSPTAEIAFAMTLYGAVRYVVQHYVSATQSFKLRDDLFQEMAVAHTYKNSLVPWIQSGVIALVASIFIIVGVKAFIKSMKDWEQQQEMKEMGQMGEDALFLMSTPVDAVPLEKKKERMRQRLTPLPQRIIGGLLDKLWLFRVGACVGYLLPLLNVLDFGDISVSLYPYALGVAPSQPIVDFMQNTLKMKYLYKAYIKSGYYFLIVWFLFIQFAVRNKAAPFFLRFHSSQAILISMLLGVPQQVFFAVLNPWESGLVVQTIMYHSMVSIFLFVLVLVAWCCVNALMKRTMKMPLVSEAAEMWAGRE